MKSWHAAAVDTVFLSTPSARRATAGPRPPRSAGRISIHALREEGDVFCFHHLFIVARFLSTPSARRATVGALERIHGRKHNFYPRPPRGGRQFCRFECTGFIVISIHALREEGDRKHNRCMETEGNFYPRPPRGGRRIQFFVPLRLYAISIHALREEGDALLDGAPMLAPISIHALREEGDARYMVVIIR